MRFHPRLLRIVAVLWTVAALGAVTLSAATRVVPPAVEAVGPAVAWQAQAFDLANVRLLPGPFQEAQELGRLYLLSLDPDRLLSGFRREAGLEPKAAVYGGWEERGVAGHSLGHYLSACSLMYRATGDEDLRARVDYVVQELAACQRANGNGYVAAIPRGKEIFAEVARGEIRSQGFDLNGGWVPWYTLHKLLAGLRDAYTGCGNAEARTVWLGLCDWALETTRNLTDDQWQVMLACEHGGMNEVLADAYAFSGDPRYLEGARRFHHRAILDPLAAQRDELAGQHANTQIPKIIGAARIHDLTADPACGVLSEFFWTTVVAHHSYVIGGNSLAEHFGPPDQLSDRLGDNTAETCNTYNMLRLTRSLFQRAARATQADYYERALWNHILASRNPEDGQVCYFVPLKSGSQKQFMTPFDSFTCCTGTGMENPARFGEAIFFHNPKTLFVTQYIPSELRWRDRELTIRMMSDLPLSGRVRLLLTANRPLDLALQLRVPRWAEGRTEIRVNGEKLPSTARPGEWLALERTWSDGDLVELDFPMTLRTEAMPDNPRRVAFFWGPVVLAADLGRPDTDPEIRTIVDNATSPEKWIVPDPIEPLRFRTRKVVRPDDVDLLPFFAIHGRRHQVYFDVYRRSEWKAHEAELRATAEWERAMEQRTLDVLRIGEMQPERDHHLQGEGTSAGDFNGRKWRHATDGGWFSFELASDPEAPLELVVTYWGSDAGNRVFDILVNGTRVATQQLERNQPGRFFDQIYPLPTSLTRGQDPITVRFQAHPGQMAGGVYGVRLLRAETAR